MFDLIGFSIQIDCTYSLRWIMACTLYTVHNVNNLGSYYMKLIDSLLFLHIECWNATIEAFVAKKIIVLHLLFLIPSYLLCSCYHLFCLDLFWCMFVVFNFKWNLMLWIHMEQTKMVIIYTNVPKISKKNSNNFQKSGQHFISKTWRCKHVSCNSSKLKC